MASPMCLRCLSRSLEAAERHTVLFATQRAFSSTTKRDAPKKPTPNQKGSATTRGGGTLHLSKKTRVKSGRPPAPGDRKAYRKRIVLSNTNAIEVQGLRDLAPAMVRLNGADVPLSEAQGQVLGFTAETVDALRALETFRPTQGWAVFHRPASLVRAETLRLAEDIAKIDRGRRDVDRKRPNDAAAQEVAGKQQDDQQGITQNTAEQHTVRRILFGEKDTGKSVLLLQAQAMALLRGFVVIHFPEGKDLTNAHTAYQPQTTPNGTIYTQPAYTATLLGNLARANQKVLSKLTLSQQHRLPVPVQPNMSLARFAELGANDIELAWPVWQALWTELTIPSTQGAEKGMQRPPVLLTMDGVDQIMCTSAYLNGDIQPIHAHDLALVKHFCGLLSGQATLPNGGMILAATCSSQPARVPTMKYWLQRLASSSEPTWNPFQARDSRVEDVMKTVSATEVHGLSKAEARGIIEYYARSGVFRGSVTDGLVSEKWTLAGSGIIGQLEKAVVRTRF